MFERKSLDVVNSLIATTIDSADGYREAAKDAENSRFREIFIDRARERDEVVATLQDHVRRHGGDAEDDGTVAAAAHRFFMDIKTAVSSRDDKAIVEEVERGEDFIKEKYETALAGSDLGPDCRIAVQKAYEKVKAGHDQMRDLKHGMQTSTAHTAH